jgi:tetratricopeptide (TPR) repeat protein
MSKAPVSVCIITRDAQQDLLELLPTVRPWVEEICLLDTGSAMPELTERIADEFGCVYRHDPSLLEDGLMVDFSAARQESFRMATQPWVMWLDSDDTLVGGNNLPLAIAWLDWGRQHCRQPLVLAADMEYFYTFDDRGNCSQRFFRERIVHYDDGWEWNRPVHEYMRLGDRKREHRLRLDHTVIHVRHRGRPGDADPERNLRILKRMWDRGSDDPSIAYYIGNELEVRGHRDEAVEWFMRCADHENDTWRATALEHAVVQLSAGECHEQAIEVADQLAYEHPNMRLARLLQGYSRHKAKQYSKAAKLFNAAFSADTPEQPLFPNPSLENKVMRLVASESCARSGDLTGARHHVGEAEKFAGPDDPNVVFYKSMFTS